MARLVPGDIYPTQQRSAERILQADLRVFLKAFYRRANIARPERAPFTAKTDFERLLSSLDQIVGIEPVKLNDLLLQVIDHGRTNTWVGSCRKGRRRACACRGSCRC
jgi:hypothetical protein